MSEFITRILFNNAIGFCLPYYSKLDGFRLELFDKFDAPLLKFFWIFCHVEAKHILSDHPTWSRRIEYKHCHPLENAEMAASL